jgi:hypothetical protein
MSWIARGQRLSPDGMAACLEGLRAPDVLFDGEGRAGRSPGVLPLVFLSSRLFGRFLVSMPFLNYGGIVTDGPEAQGRCSRRGGSRQELGRPISSYGTRIHGYGWPHKQHKVSMRLELPGRFAILWKDFRQASSGSSAQKEGMTVRIGEEILDDFIDCFYETCAI